MGKHRLTLSDVREANRQGLVSPPRPFEDVFQEVMSRHYSTRLVKTAELAAAEGPGA